MLYTALTVRAASLRYFSMQFDFFTSFIDIFSDARLDGKVKSAMNANRIQAAFMEHAKNRGNAIAVRGGVVYFAIKI